MAHHIERLFEEESDTLIAFTIFSEDGVTPVDSDIIEEIKVWLRDKEDESMIVEGDDVTDQLGPDGAMRLLVPAAWTETTFGSTTERQLRLLTLRIEHSEGKVRYEEITFHIDAMQDSPQG